MAKTVEIKIPEDIEFRVIGNALGLLIASAGLLAGEMMRQGSLQYWLADVVPLLLLAWMGFRLYRNFLSTMIAYPDAPVTQQHPVSSTNSIQNEQVIAGQITSKPPTMSAEKIVEKVAKRIETQKAEALKKNKFTN